MCHGAILQVHNKGSCYSYVKELKSQSTASSLAIDMHRGQVHAHIKWGLCSITCMQAQS
jgi:hypothetical protein